jgi:hypothetical protein
METTKVGIREFRSGLAEYIAANRPVAVTRHGQTVGIFIPTSAPSQADLHALEQATARFAELMPLSEAEVESMAADFETERKAARRRARK